MDAALVAYREPIGSSLQIGGIATVVYADIASSKWNSWPYDRVVRSYGDDSLGWPKARNERIGMAGSTPHAGYRSLAVQLRTGPSTTQLSGDVPVGTPRREARAVADEEDHDVTDTTETRRHEPLRSNARVGGGDVREVERDGRTYLTFPTVAAREMVMNYPEDGTRELLPADKIRETADLWSGTSIAYLHPQNDTQSAQTADAYTSTVIGQAHDPEIVGDDRLRVNSWIDVDKAESIGGMAAEVVDALRSGEELPVSAAYTSIGDRRVNGTHDGEAYDVEQGTPIPDHIAIFPSDAPFEARCSPEDGCAAPRANAVVDGDAQTHMATEPDDDPPDPGTVRRVLNFLGVEDEAHDDCGCDGSCDECRQTTENASESGTGGGPPDTTGDDPDGAEADAQSDTTDVNDHTMTEDKIESLAEQSTFDADTLDEWDDEALEALEQTIDQHSDSTDAENTEDADAETEDAATDADADAVTANAEEKPEWAEDLATKDDVPDDSDIASVVRDTLEQEDLRPDAEVVANARDDLSVEDALDMPEGVLRDLAEEEKTANFAAVPGPVDRSPDEPEDDAEDYPSGGFTSWKANAEGDD